MAIPEKTLQSWSAEHPDWEINPKYLKRTLTLSNFREAVRFVNRVAEVAERLDHHPDILIHSWNKVTLTLSSHDTGGITARDLRLAEEIERLLREE